MRKQSNWRYLFEKVTQILFCKLKSNALLYQFLEKSNLITYLALTRVTCNALSPQLTSDTFSWILYLVTQENVSQKKNMYKN